MFGRQYELVRSHYPQLGGRRLVHEVVRRMIDYTVNDLIDASTAAIAAAAPESADDVRALSAPLLTFSEPVRAEHLELKRYLREHLYKHYRVLRMTTKAGRVAAFNGSEGRHNAANPDSPPLKESSSEFIVKASGIKNRYVENKTGLLDPERMCPNIPDRPEEQLSCQAEYSVNAAKRALAAAGKTGEDIDLVVLGASNLQRL